ncbi:hypothetical protein D9757_005096 [Collybiopsis confluens]|uniref:Mitochondrial distribution and morphology protein 12 n=1 Tax=Collybiopsis confluens TaxID=2823264 RepID=A0A8H5MCG6_9AGAR|nr:hypothetical protein D9757_005096 [Collybiopsis confluens]
MSIELDWALLNPALSDTLVSLLNNTLLNTTRPSFIGPVQVTSIEFGERAPEVELVDMRDIYRDFLDDDEVEDDDENPDAGLEGGRKHHPFNGQQANFGDDDVDGFEWVSRKTARREEGLASLQQRPMNMFASTPTLPTLNGLHSPLTNSPLNVYSPLHQSLQRGHLPSPLHLHEARELLYNRPAYSYSASGSNSPFRGPLSPSVFPAQSIPPSPSGRSDQSLGDDSPSLERQHSDLNHTTPDPPLTTPPANPHPNLQLHFHISWHSDLRITLTTSLLINYPSPGFMSLPIKLSVTGLVFEGEVVVGYEGDPGSSGRKKGKPNAEGSEEAEIETERRIHLCILDELDPYGPKVDRQKRNSFASDTSPLVTPGEVDHHHPLDDYVTPATAAPLPTTAKPHKDDIDPDSDPLALSSALPQNPRHQYHHHHSSSNKPFPIGIRLLPSIYIESEIGQADKHVLKNVNRVERFIQDVIRKTVEEELVFPNYCTVVLGAGAGMGAGEGEGKGEGAEAGVGRGEGEGATG